MSSSLAWGLNKCHRNAQGCNGKYYGSRDRISELPNEILVLIISLLKLKEAARTSVLSWRWRNLWTHTFTLNFDYSDEDYYDNDKWLFRGMSAYLPKGGKLRLVKRPQFVALVNKVLSLHQGFTIDEFEVSCKLYGRIRKQFIDEWLEFALRKQVKRLKLDFNGKVSSLYGSYSITKPLLCKYNLDNLTVLCLEKVDVTGKVLQYILFKCHRLEVLRVRKSYSLMKLKVPGPSPQLKCVEVKHCSRLKFLKICAINIESLAYHGPDIPITFSEVPRLVQASVGGIYASIFDGSTGKFSSYISHLVSLVLDLRYPMTSLIDEKLPQFPMLENLRELELAMAHIGVESIMNWCTSMLKKCPNLRRLSLEARAKRDASRIGEWRMEGAVDCLHSHLEVLELVEARGDEYESFIARSMVERLPSLQQLILRPFSTTSAFANDFIRSDITLFVERLKKILPPRVDVIVLWSTLEQKLNGSMWLDSILKEDFLLTGQVDLDIYLIRET